MFWRTLVALVLVGCASKTPPPVVAVPPQPAQPPPSPAETAAPPFVTADAPSAPAAAPAAAPTEMSLDHLTSIARFASMDLPKMLDKVTREEAITAEPGMLVYHNRLVGKRVGQLSVPVFERVLKPSIVKNDCSNPNVRTELLDKGVKLRYTYVDMDGAVITTVDVVRADCP